MRRLRGATLDGPEHDGGGPGLYEGGQYGASAGVRDLPLRPLRAFADRERMRLLGPLPPGGRVIEVGAGRGRLVAALRVRGHDAVGIEPTPARRGRRRPRPAGGARWSWRRRTSPPGEADLVVFWHVLEHLDDPHEALRRVEAVAAGRGRAVVAAPNLASLQARIGGDRWFHQDVPRHRTLFTPAGL